LDELVSLVRSETAQILDQHFQRQQTIVRLKEREIEDLTAKLESTRASLETAKAAAVVAAAKSTDGLESNSLVVHTPVKGAGSNLDYLSSNNNGHQLHEDSSILVTPSGTGGRRHGASPNVSAKELAKLHAEMTAEVTLTFIIVWVINYICLIPSGDDCAPCRKSTPTCWVFWLSKNWS
jgi:hypothetical protein